MPTEDSKLPDQHSLPPAVPVAPGLLFDSERVDAVFASLDAPPSPPPPPPPQNAPRLARKRRVKLPVILFLLTLVSTFWVGANRWLPTDYAGQSLETMSLMPLRRVLWSEWQNGLIYMACIIAILLSHELGHFFMTLRYRIAASLPFFIPCPIIPLGTMGAVIAMDGSRADRKEIFDIGIAGPLAGLVFAIPIAWIGLLKLDFTGQLGGPYLYDLPLGMRLVLDWLSPQGYIHERYIYHTQMNPYFMAGWAGCLVTGLNMLPVSQLDGGHVIYCLFGKNGKWVARGFLVFAVAYVVYAQVIVWSLMIIVVFLLGPDHPPTRDDSVKLGWTRTILGWSSLLIPILCFPVRALQVINGL